MRKRIVPLTCVAAVMGWSIVLLGGLSPQRADCSSSGFIGSTGNNCAMVRSCGSKLGQCYRVGFGGGSQFVFDNRIQACLQDPHRNCYDVKCRVKQFTDQNCRDLDDDSTVDRRGCSTK